MSDAMRPIPVGQVASISDAVAFIHLLRQRTAMGFDISPAMHETLNRIDALPCYEVPDFVGLIELATILVNHIATSAAGDRSQHGVNEAMQAANYLNRALPQLQSAIKDVLNRAGQIDN